MLVSVSERTREIGLRKALGARPEVVLLQFLIEAVTLCLCGGGLGLLLGQLIVLGMNMTSIEALKMASIPMWAIILSVGFSAFIGVVFGMFPAIKAARLNPIDALRHD
jgi:putative ABC transport system permease protein